jgi:hypothetical protein
MQSLAASGTMRIELSADGEATKLEQGNTRRFGG